ncbi:hypothetical protein HC928_05890 [bacterium]|nr:hypothetical protein [bacterium]
MGGIGKSTLASALAWDCQVRRHYRDGILWIEVGQTPAIPSLQARIGVHFGDDRDNYRDEQDGLLALSRVLRDRAALIVLDDVWDARLVERFPVAGTACRLLITTRSAELATRVQGEDIRLNLLSQAEGAELIARQAGGDAHDPTYRQIVQALGGHTLAITLAGARIRKKGTAYATKILAGLENSADPFANLNVDKEDKDLNLGKSLAQSLALLDDDLRRRFRLLGGAGAGCWV